MGRWGVREEERWTCLGRGWGDERKNEKGEEVQRSQKGWTDKRKGKEGGEQEGGAEVGGG